jgi:phosphatidylglycerophosphatase A
MDALARRIASVGGVGHLPWAPGSWASLVALGLARLLSPLPVPAFMATWLSLAVLGCWSAELSERRAAAKDPGWIVIDEVVGMLVAATFIDRSSWLELGCAFVLFRAFDMLKPWPIRALERHVRGGVGVVIDDVAAGLCAALVLSFWF